VKSLAWLAVLPLMASCARPAHAPQPVAPPRIQVEAKTYPKQTPHLGDMPISGCTVTAESGNRADCICRRAATKIDVHDPSKQSLVCK
jgi:hypothetical protein